MALSKTDWAKLGAYGSPFSGNGMEFYPLGVPPDTSGIVLHETGYVSARPFWNYPNVLSPFWRLYYDFRAGHKVVFPDKEVELGPDRIVLIPNHCLFHAIGTRPMPKFWLTFHCARQLSTHQIIPVELRPRSFELDLMREIAGLFTPRSLEKNRRRIFHCSLAVLHEVLSRPEIAWLEETPAPIAKALHHIEKNFSEPLYNRDLARSAYLSETAFNRLFRECQGVSPARHIARVRVREAARLLVQSDFSIDQIAEQCGFPNRAYFTRVFMRMIGESPARLRRLGRIKL